ncbi:tetratricopeptide repeat protein [Bacteroidota bacterium]
MGPISLNFKSGSVEGDLGNDKSIDIVSDYTIEKDRIKFTDKTGVTCPEPGIYQVHITDHYISFDLLEDNCGGRVKSTMGFWVRPEFQDIIAKLSEELSTVADPETYLNRARMYMATGKSYEARQDFDKYIEQDQSDARVFINRAGTRFPSDMQGVVEDCNTAIALDPASKNAYFLRGLALYELGEKEKACKDFYEAINLGFTILKEAEKAKCSEYWESILKE